MVLTSSCTSILGHHLEDTVSEASPEFQRPPRVSTSCPWKESCCSVFSPLFVPSLTPAQEEDLGAGTAAVTTVAALHDTVIRAASCPALPLCQALR